MNALRTIVVSSTAALGLVFVSGVCSAQSYIEAKTVKVKYDEFDLNSDKGAAALYARLRSAAKEACAPLDGRELRLHAAYTACYNHALSDAVVEVNRDTVTALHQRSTHTERAS